MKLAEADILFLPGLGNSGPGHWQRRWGDRFVNGSFVQQDDWNHPDRASWVAEVQRAVLMATRPVVIVAHSLGVLTIAHAAHGFTDTKVRGAFLVAPPDYEAETFPDEAAEFSWAPSDPLPFPSMLVASTDDPYCTIDRAVDFATSWGSDFHIAGASGHINIASGHGPWPEGLLMFTRLMQRLKS